MSMLLEINHNYEYYQSLICKFDHKLLNKIVPDSALIKRSATINQSS